MVSAGRAAIRAGQPEARSLCRARPSGRARPRFRSRAAARKARRPGPISGAIWKEAIGLPVIDARSPDSEGEARLDSRVRLRGRPAPIRLQRGHTHASIDAPIGAGDPTRTGPDVHVGWSLARERPASVVSLARSVAKAGIKTIVVDADLRKPAIAAQFGTRRGPCRCLV